MVNEAQRENTRAVLKQMFDVWDARADSYGEIMFCSAVARAFDGKWQSALTLFLPLQEDRSEASSLQADYEHFRLFKATLPMDRVRTVLSDMVEKDRLCLPNVPELQMEVSAHVSSSRHFLDSSSNRFPVEFPCDEFMFNIDHSQTGNFRGGLLYHLALPLFPSWKEAAAYFFRVQVGDQNRVSVLAPDYRGKIQEVRIGTNSVTVEAACPRGDLASNLIGKLYSRSHGGISDCADLRFLGGKATVKISDFPRDLVVALLSTKDSELVDQRQFLAGSVYRSEGVVIDAPEEDLEQMIQFGESEVLEFKRELPRSREEIAISVTSFANRHGGKLLIGVAKDCQITGCTLDNPKDTIAQILRSHCDPPLAIAINEVTIRGLPVIVVTVPEGADKPYLVRDKGTYTRAQGTTRIATRYEIDEMYRLKENPYSGAGAVRAWI